ncbi:hypothetical protein IWQ61_009061 [Dispira simplex]|nr:hypothetical protein IWQ61_009061 [Dispira simplex]
MDQQYAYGFIAREIKHYDAGRIVPVSDVTAIAHMFLECADKDGRHGYVRSTEPIYRPITSHVGRGDEDNNQHPDKAKFDKEPYRDCLFFHVVHADDKRNALVVSCKSDHDCTPRAIDQICAYLNLADFPAGLLLSQRRAFFFFRGKDGKEGIQRGPEFSDISQHVPQIADIIRSL